MAHEIERKFWLRSASLIELLQEEGLSLEKSEIEQVYTKIEEDSESRVRCENGRYFLTNKTGSGLVREEFEEEVSQKIFALAYQNRIGEAIRKTRYSFKLGNQVSCIDIYKDIKDLIVLEVEFENEKSAKSYLLPSFIQNHVKKEITKEKGFKNKHLAFSLPFSDTNISLERLQILAKKREINSLVALQVILLDILSKIKAHQENYKISHEDEDLHQFRVNIRKTRSLLKCLKEVFAPELAKRYSKGFKLIANATNQSRDLDVFRSYLDELERSEAGELKNILEDKSQKVQNILEDPDVVAFLAQWEKTLHDNSPKIKGQDSDKNVKTVATKAIKEHLESIKNKIANLEENTNLHSYHKIRIEFKKIRYLSESFKAFVGKKTLEKLISKLKQTQEIFGLLQDRDTQKNICQNLCHRDDILSDVQKIHAIESINECINNDIYVYKIKILNSKKKLLKRIEKTLNKL